MPNSPYKGLLPYTQADAKYFFGRDSERRIIADNLRASRLTVLYGESGVGKSSVLSAGVAHDLRDDPEYAIVLFRSWRDDPTAALARAIVEVGGSHPGLAEIGPTSSSNDLVQLVERYAQSKGRDLLVILDQFEEYFQYHPMETGDATLAQQLPRLLNREELPVKLLISIREDGLASLDCFKCSIPTLFDNYLRVDFLTKEAAQEAICKPIEQFNRDATAKAKLLELIRQRRPGEAINPHWKVREILNLTNDRGNLRSAISALTTDTDVKGILDSLEDSAQVRALLPTPMSEINEDVARRVVGEIINAQGDQRQRVQTPYLQLVMSRWWEREVQKGSQEMREQTLNELGGVRKIVDDHLGTTIRGLDSEEQRVAAAIFDYMVTSAGRKVAQSVSELADSTRAERSRVQGILEKLRQARVVTPVPPPRGSHSEDKCYEFAHDVVAQAALKWRTAYVSAKERAEAEKRAALRAAEQEKQAFRERESAQARALVQEHERRAEERAKAARRFGGLLAALAVMFVMAVSAAVMARIQKGRAESSAQLAVDRSFETEKAKELARQRLDRIVESIGLKHAVLNGEAIPPKYVNKQIRFHVTAKEYPYRSRKGDPTYGFTISPVQSSIPGGLQSVAFIDYRMQHPTFPNSIFTTGPDRNFTASYDGVGCLSKVVALIEYSNPDSLPTVATFDMCAELGPDWD